jgi:hypothetical protein
MNESYFPTLSICFNLPAFDPLLPVGAVLFLVALGCMLSSSVSLAKASAVSLKTYSSWLLSACHSKALISLTSIFRLPRPRSIMLLLNTSKLTPLSGLLSFSFFSGLFTFSAWEWPWLWGLNPYQNIGICMVSEHLGSSHLTGTILTVAAFLISCAQESTLNVWSYSCLMKLSFSLKKSENSSIDLSLPLASVALLSVLDSF